MDAAQLEQHRNMVREAFDLLFNQRDYERARAYWSDGYIQHSAHVPAGREGLFALVASLPTGLRYEAQLVVADGDHVIAHGRFSGTGRARAWIAADVLRIENGKFVEHWDVLQDEATAAESQGGHPMFGDAFAQETP
jgi:predicted SnoaL-like aldol condensation-catalyzing enzyme